MKKEITDAESIIGRELGEAVKIFAYPYGDGWVIYSTILLDFYLAGGGTVPAFSEIYAPNIVNFGAMLGH